MVRLLVKSGRCVIHNMCVILLFLHPPHVERQYRASEYYYKRQWLLQLHADGGHCDGLMSIHTLNTDNGWRVADLWIIQNRAGFISTHVMTDNQLVANEVRYRNGFMPIFVSNYIFMILSLLP